MEVVDLEKKAVQDENYDTAELDFNGELTQDPETVDKFQQNHWQFSDEGRAVQKCFLELFAYCRVYSIYSNTLYQSTAMYNKNNIIFVKLNK